MGRAMGVYRRMIAFEDVTWMCRYIREILPRENIAEFHCTFQQQCRPVHVLLRRDLGHSVRCPNLGCVGTVLMT
jgi:hypothetical protein